MGLCFLYVLMIGLIFFDIHNAYTCHYFVVKHLFTRLNNFTVKQRTCSVAQICGRKHPSCFFQWVDQCSIPISDGCKHIVPILVVFIFVEKLF